MYSFVKIRKISDNQKVINKFISGDNIPWAREASLSKRLILKYGIEFLLWVPLPDNKKISTLLWLTCNEGYRYLDAYLFDYKKSKINLSTKITPIKLSENKIGEDKAIQRIESFQDFIKIYVQKQSN